MLRNFDEYPNDVARGFNLPHMPIRFNVKDTNLQIFSQSILVMTPEPDFSMPFNVNAVTHVLFGSLIVNTVSSLYMSYKDEKKDLLKLKN